VPRSPYTPLRLTCVGSLGRKIKKDNHIKEVLHEKSVSVCGVAVLFLMGAVATVYAADNPGSGHRRHRRKPITPLAAPMAKIWNSKIKDMNVTAQTSGASAENVRLVNKKEVELALVQSDTLDFAFNATEAFKEPLKAMNAIAVLYPEVIQVVVAAAGPIKSIADLKGRRWAWARRAAGRKPIPAAPRRLRDEKRRCERAVPVLLRER